MSGDHTQSPNSEPGNPDVPPLIIGIGDGEGCELFTLSPAHAPHPRSGVCLVGDGWSDVATTPPNDVSLDEYKRIERLCHMLHEQVRCVERIETLLASHGHGVDMRERINRIGVSLSNRPDLIGNAESLVEMGS